MASLKKRGNYWYGRWIKTVDGQVEKFKDQFYKTGFETVGDTLEIRGVTKADVES